MILVVRKCDDCPFCRSVNPKFKRQCAVGNPPNRPIMDEDERPTWCRLEREQIIVKNFQ